MNNDKIEKALQKSILFAGIGETEKKALLAISNIKWVPKNTTIFSEGETAKGFYLVISGKIKIFKISQDGKEHILHIFGPGEPVGEVPVFSDQDYPAFAETLKESHLLYFPRNRFLDLAKERPQILLNMLATLSIRLRQFAQKIERLSLKEVASHLAEVLLEMARDAEPTTDNMVELTITKGQLASQIGTTPETLSRTFQKLGSQGLIQVDRKRVAILDIEGLKEVAQSS